MKREYGVMLTKRERGVLGTCQRTKKTMRVTVIRTVIGRLGMVPKDSLRRFDVLEIRRRIETIHIVTIGQNAEKNPGDPGRLAVRWIPIKV